MGRPEDSRVKIPALINLTRLGYEYLSHKNLISGEDYNSDSNIFYSQFKDALNRINNSELNDNQIKKIVNEINIKLSNE